MTTKPKKAAAPAPAAVTTPRFGDLITLWAIRPLPAYNNAVGFVAVDKSLVAAILASGDAVDPNEVYPLPFIEEPAPPDPNPDPDPDPEPESDDEPDDEPVTTQVFPPKDD